MTGPEHFVAGEDCLYLAQRGDSDARDHLVQKAQAHFAAALAAATAMAGYETMPAPDRHAWLNAVRTPVPEGIRVA